MTLLFVLMTTFSLSAKCDWSSLKLQQWNQRNYYKWYLSGKVLDDTCVDYMFTMIDAQTKKVDTLYSFRGLVEVEFNKKGKYYLRVVLKNKCEGCDTLIYRPVEIIYFPNCKFVYNIKSSDGVCYDSLSGEMTSGPWTKGDTCWEWYSYIWNGPLLDSLTKFDFENMSDLQLWNYYDFNDSDMVWYDGPRSSARFINYKFPHTGNYLVATQWYNKCLDQDTFFFTRIHFDDCATSRIKLLNLSLNGVIVFPNPADDRITFTLTSPIKIPVTLYEIYDENSRLIETGKMGSSISIVTSKWNSGVYVVKIGKLSQKFIIQH